MRLKKCPSNRLKDDLEPSGLPMAADANQTTTSLCKQTSTTLSKDACSAAHKMVGVSLETENVQLKNTLHAQLSMSARSFNLQHHFATLPWSSAGRQHNDNSSESLVTSCLGTLPLEKIEGNLFHQAIHGPWRVALTAHSSCLLPRFWPRHAPSDAACTVSNNERRKNSCRALVSDAPRRRQASDF